MPALHFAPEQFKLNTIDCEGHGPHPDLVLRQDVASELANQAVSVRNERQDFNTAWPEDTAVIVNVGTSRSYGPKRSALDGAYRENPVANFGFRLPPEGISAQTLIHSAFLRSVLQALDNDEIGRYNASSVAPSLIHPVRFVAIETLKSRRDRKRGMMANSIIRTLPKDYAPLLEPAG